MAIIATHKTQHGISLPAAYINIVTVQTFKQVVRPEGGDSFNQHTIRVYANVYADEQSFKDGRPEVENIERVYLMDTEQPAHNQAYRLLRDEFAGAAA